MTASPGTITELEAIRLLVDATPSFAERFAELREEWSAEIDDRDFIAEGPTATALAVHLVHCFEAGDTSPFARINPVLDRVLSEGTEEARGLAMVSIIDELKDADHYSRHTPDDLRAHLGPVAQRAWANGDEYWKPEVHISVAQWIFIAVFTGLIVWLAVWMGFFM